MSRMETLTADGVVGDGNNILFSLTFTSQITAPTPPATGPCYVEVRDSDTADGSGDLLVRLVITDEQKGGHETVFFPAGVLIMEGIACNITTGGHGDLTVSVDYA